MTDNDKSLLQTGDREVVLGRKWAQASEALAAIEDIAEAYLRDRLSPSMTMVRIRDRARAVLGRSRTWPPDKKGRSPEPAEPLTAEEAAYEKGMTCPDCGVYGDGCMCGSSANAPYVTCPACGWTVKNDGEFDLVGQDCTYKGCKEPLIAAAGVADAPNDIHVRAGRADAETRHKLAAYRAEWAETRGVADATPGEPPICPKCKKALDDLDGSGISEWAPGEPLTEGEPE